MNPYGHSCKWCTQRRVDHVGLQTDRLVQHPPVTLYWSVVIKSKTTYISILIYGHELLVVTERMRSRIQTMEMSFLQRVAVLSLRNRVKSSIIWEGLRVEPLLLHMERSQLMWFRHLTGMPPRKRFFRHALPAGGPRIEHNGETLSLVRECVSVLWDELEEVVGEGGLDISAETAAAVT